METKAENRIVEEMLKEGPWLAFRKGVTGAVIELRYRSSQPYMNVKISVGDETPGGGGKKPRGLMFNVNFHHDFLPDQSGEKEIFINSLKLRHDEFLEFLKISPF